MPVRTPRQLCLPVPNTRGGRRSGAGRKPKGLRAGVPHLVRPYHEAAHPAHVTLRAVAGLPSFRATRVFPRVRAALAAASRRGFRLVHFSVQGNHIHLLVEAKNRQALIRGVQGLAIRLARAINRVLARRGAVWADRYHARTLTSPREVRAALVYVLNNVKKHQPGFRGLDLCSSGPWFTGWRIAPASPPAAVSPPVGVARTWLLEAGWRRHGLIAAEERPRSPVPTPEG